MSTLTLVAAILIIGIAPFSVGAAAFLWSLHAVDRGKDTRNPKPLLRLSFVLAVVGSISAVAGTYLGVVAFLRLLGLVALASALAPITLAAFVLLDLVPIFIALYLRMRGS